MSTGASTTKDAARASVRAALSELNPEDRPALSASICGRIQQSKVWRDAVVVMLFDPLPDEPDVWPLAVAALSSGKALALPRFTQSSGQYQAARVASLQDDLQPGKYGIREPASGCPVVSLNQLDLVLVPGVAFDACGHRLGRGKGYFDRMLQGVRGVRLGVGFDVQLVKRLPVDPHDQQLNCIVTPTRWLTVDEGARI